MQNFMTNLFTMIKLRRYRKIDWSAIRDSFNPSVTCKRYKVELMEWREGHFKYFWFKKHAMYYFQLHCSEHPWAYVRDTWLRKQLTSFDRGDNFIVVDGEIAHTLSDGTPVKS